MQNNEITSVNSKRRLMDLKLKEIWKYRDLIMLFVKRDFKNSYKQTILGPLWVIINPLLSTTVFTVIFGMIANISTDGLPQFLFYMSGNVLWHLFASNLNKSSSVFIGNARLFGKVYFPRLVIILSGMIYNLVTFAVQFTVFIVLAIIYMNTGANVHPNLYALLLPLFIIQLSLLGTGVGMIISSFTTKYRDLNVLVNFGVMLWMYITPIVYPISQVPNKLKSIMLLNPVAPIIETLRYGLLGCGQIEWMYLSISIIITVIILFIGVILFNQVEKDFIDTV